MILIAIGSNLSSTQFGNPINNCLEAINKLELFFKVTKISNWYETEPIPKSEQPWFVNGIVNVITDKRPEEIMRTLLVIEKEFGRLRSKKNEARVIDLDLIAYDNLVIKTKFLILPHPRMHERLFVLKPLNDIFPNWKHPVLKKNVKSMLNMIKNYQNINEYKI